MFAADPQIPWSVIVAVGVLIGGGVLTWVAYVAKQLVEHAKWMAAANVALEHAIEIGNANAQTIDEIRAEQERVRLELARSGRVGA